MLQQSQQPFQTIKDIKRNYQKFQHLTCVDVFMPQVVSCNFHPLSYEDKSEKVDGSEASERDETIDNQDEGMQIVVFRECKGLRQFQMKRFAKADERGVEVAEMA